MSTLEIVAALLGLVSVWLNTRENVWGWPVGAVMVALYIVVFARVQLYADAGLQAVFFVLQFYGWYEWLHGGRARTRLLVTRTPPQLLLALLATGAAGTLLLGTLLGRHTDQALPFWDSGIAAFSLVAQWMMARKLLESWTLWFAIDVVAVGVYWSKALHPTAALYAVFLALCVVGWRDWSRSMRVHGAPDAMGEHVAPVDAGSTAS
ncbi:MAG TPA: nicotinamide riboside transporter PnuC [Gemmatimonadaceae bacterium]|nr:nicotinamide riboside transporter PnuC [Gemmatimonadaceae bacterium]